MATYRFGGSGRRNSAAPKFVENQYRLLKHGDDRPVSSETVKLPSFKTRKEVEEFVNRDVLDCPICGAQFRNLGLHLKQGHSISAREFKLATGIPIKFSLVCMELKEEFRERTRKRHAAGEICRVSSGYHHGKREVRARKPDYWYQEQSGKYAKGRKVRQENLRKAKAEKVEKCKELLRQGYSKNQTVKSVKTSWEVVLEAEKALMNG